LKSRGNSSLAHGNNSRPVAAGNKLGSNSKKLNEISSETEILSRILYLIRHLRMVKPVIRFTKNFVFNWRTFSPDMTRVVSTLSTQAADPRVGQLVRACLVRQAAARVTAEREREALSWG
jgi:hypothetical protein